MFGEEVNGRSLEEERGGEEDVGLVWWGGKMGEVKRKREEV